MGNSLAAFHKGEPQLRHLMAILPSSWVAPGLCNFLYIYSVGALAVGFQGKSMT